MSKKNNSKLYASDFWLDDYYDSKEWLDDDESDGPVGPDLMEMASYRRAVANFVRIVAGKDIPVRYSTGNDSYTNGKEVTISASTKLSERDSQVGLALHEGSHCILTDFNFLKQNIEYINNGLAYIGSGDYDDSAIEKFLKMTEVAGTEFWTQERIDMCKEWHDINEWLSKGRLKDMFNIIEDRRIDDFIKRTAPGYRPYYEALYDRYFNNKLIDKGLRSDEYREENWDSYVFRILNIMNPNSDLKALNCLQQISDLIDLKNINRLKSTQDATALALEVIALIRKSVNESKPQSNTPAAPDPDINEINPGGQGNGPELDNHDLADDTSPKQSDPASGGKNKLSDKDKQSLDKKIQDQKMMTKGESKKKKVSKKLSEQLESLLEGGVESVDVMYNGQKVKTTVVSKLTRNLVENVSCEMWHNYHDNRQLEAIDSGLRKGTTLGKKLKLRAESRSTVFNRLRSGRIDKRMIASAGYDNESIFSKVETFSYRDGIIHISIDNSGSMYGDKFRKALEAAAAIAKACKLAGNLDCVISFRSTGSVGSSRGNGSPIIVVAYDSRKQNIGSLRWSLAHMQTSGATPEGLCFDAIMDLVIKDSNGKDSFFLNFSDGEPAYSERVGSSYNYIEYSGEDAAAHTAKQVNRMLNSNIKVISYFIGDLLDSDGNVRDTRSTRLFRKMYGRDAQFVNTEDIFTVARTMNNKFLEVA